MPVYRFDGSRKRGEVLGSLVTEDIYGVRRTVALHKTIELSDTQHDDLNRYAILSLTTDPIPNSPPADDLFLVSRGPAGKVLTAKGIDRNPEWDDPAGPDPSLASFDPRSYGAIGDERRVNDAAMTSGSAVLTSSTAEFTNADIGKMCVVTSARGGDPGEADGETNPLTAKILSVQSATQVTLDTAATASVSDKRVHIATSDSLAFQAAVDAAHDAGGGDVPVPPGHRFLLTMARQEDVEFVGNQLCAVRLKQGVRLVGAGGTIVYPWQGTYDGDTDRQTCIISQSGDRDATLIDVKVDGGEPANVPINERPYVVWMLNGCGPARAEGCEFVGMRGKALRARGAVQLTTRRNIYHDSSSNYLGGDTSFLTAGAEGPHIRSYGDTARDHTNLATGGMAESIVCTDAEEVLVEDFTTFNFGDISVGGVTPSAMIVRPRLRPAPIAGNGHAIQVTGTIGTFAVIDADIDASAALGMVNGVGESGEVSIASLEIRGGTIKPSATGYGIMFGNGSTPIVGARIVAPHVVGAILCGPQMMDSEIVAPVCDKLDVRGPRMTVAAPIVAGHYTHSGSDGILTDLQGRGVGDGYSIVQLSGPRTKVRGGRLEAVGAEALEAVLRVEGDATDIDGLELVTKAGTFAAAEFNTGTNTRYGPGVKMRGAGNNVVFLPGAGTRQEAATGAVVAATTLGTVAGKVAVRDATGTIIGYAPIYDAIT